MAINNKRLSRAVLTFTTPTLADFSCQITNVTVTNNTPDGDRVFTLCADGTGEFRQTVDPAWQVDLTWVSDWTTSGLNRYLATNDGATVQMVIHLDNSDASYGRTWTGNVVLKQPSDGGDARALEMSKATWNFIGAPALTFGA